MFTREERSTFPYWFAHWCAFQMTALNCGSWKFKYLFHDCEKPWLRLFLPYKKVQMIHRKHNRHHPEWLEHKLFDNSYDLDYCPDIIEKYLNRFDYDSAIIDWECCHYTKIEEPLDAYDEYKRILDYEYFKNKYPLITKYCYNKFSIRLMNSIKRLGLENK